MLRLSVGSSSDHQLLERWATGDQPAGAALFDRYYPPVERFFKNKVVSEAEQDDLVQATFAACLESADRYRGEGPFRSFLFGIAYNVLRRHFERARSSRLDFTEVSAVDLAPGPSSVAAVRENQRRVADALRSLPVDSQVVLELFYWESMTAGEIGESLGLPEGTVRTRLRAARTQLRQVLESDPQAVDELARSLA